MAETPARAMMKIQLYASPICCSSKQKAIVRSLGLKKLSRIVERPDSPEFHGMVNKIPHLIRIVE